MLKRILENIEMLLVNFIMIYIIHKILVSLKITKILKMLFMEYNRLLFFKKINDGKI